MAGAGGGVAAFAVEELLGEFGDGGRVMGVDPSWSATVVSVMVTLSVVRRLIRATGWA